MADHLFLNQEFLLQEKGSLSKVQSERDQQSMQSVLAVVACLSTLVAGVYAMSFARGAAAEAGMDSTQQFLAETSAFLAVLLLAAIALPKIFKKS